VEHILKILSVPTPPLCTLGPARGEAIVPPMHDPLAHFVALYARCMSAMDSPNEVSEEACMPTGKNCNLSDFPKICSEEACMPIGNNCGLLSSDVSELNCCVPCDTNIPVWKSLMYHMRRRLLGHVVQLIHLATDALKVLTNEKHWTRISEEGKHSKEWHFKINEALRPWVLWWAGLRMKGPTKKIVGPWLNSFTSSNVDKEHTVYLRLNISNDDMYIGKSSDYRNRFSQHTRQVARHSCKLCRCCNECYKYNKQAKIPFTRWITVPLACAASSSEALSLEKWWINPFASQCAQRANV
jgi:hypothetical protein